MFRQIRPALVSVVAFTVLCGIVFPAVITGLGQALFPRQANGSLVSVGGRVVGSALIGQTFSGPGYFHGRPSAAGAGYDGGASGGTNLGPTSDKLIHGVHVRLPDGSEEPGGFAGVADLAVAYRLENGLPAGAPVPPDAVTRSASGLDPHITPANAALQTPRVARERGLPEPAVRAAVARNMRGRQLGVLGEPRVDVLALNLELDRIAAGAATGIPC